MINLRLFPYIGFLKGLYFYTPIFAFYFLYNGVSLSNLILSQTLYSLFVFLGEVPTGLIADKFGQKFSIILGYIIEAFGISVILFMPNIFGLYLSDSIRGIGGSFISGSEEALIYESVKKSGRHNFQKVYGNFLSNQQVGFVVATALSGIAYSRLGSDSFVILILATVVSLIVAICISMFLTDFKAEIMDPLQGSQGFVMLKQAFLLIRNNTTIFTLLVVSILTIGQEYFIQDVYQPYFDQNGVHPIWIGLTISIGTFINIFATRYVYILEKYLSLEKILFILIFPLGLSYIFMAIFPMPIVLVILYILMNVLFDLQTPIVSDYVNSHTKSSIRTTVLSSISLFRRFFQIFFTWILATVLGIWNMEISLIVQGSYLIVGITIGYYLLVRCGCSHKIPLSKRL